MNSRNRKVEEETDINITPMLDIVFIMLIFFIVSTSFVKETGIDPDRPTAATARPMPQGNILIGVDMGGRVWMNNQVIPVNQVSTLVENSVNENPESSAILVADEGAPAGVVLDVMEQVRLGGVSNIAIAADPEAT
jgi:biopolymer transport protein ExbD